MANTPRTANDIRATMQQHAGVFRTQASMDEGVKKIAALRERVAGHHAEGQVQGVQHRAHRGAGSGQPDRSGPGHHGVGRRPQGMPRRPHRGTTTSDPADDPTAPLGRNDANWLKHTLWHSEGNSLTYKPVNLKPLTVDSVPPKVRTF
jgi:succinate dehydrogenase / fumarate reductase flavoprotein subunit